jgi:MoaA/NifB/PqqE/SkfB family radical SAM enzyme
MGLLKTFLNQFAPARRTADGKRARHVLYLYGDDAELHDRIYGEQGSFAALYAYVKERAENERTFHIDVGITRRNFYRIPEIINYAFSLFGKQIHLNHSFSLFPLHSVAVRFKQHVKDVQDVLDQQKRVSLSFHDPELMELLVKIQEEVKRHPYKEREYIRFFSIICEKTFIGPATIVMDPHHLCNTNCRHCWVHTPVLKQPQEFLDRKLDFELFKTIVDDAAELKTDLIILQGDGEPLMYAHTMDMLKYIRAKGIEAMFFTNGSLLDEKKAREIIDIGVREIYCSLPAGTAETYGRVCPQHKGDAFFEKITKNLKGFIALRKKLGKEYPRLVMTHVMHNENYEDIIPMARLDAEIGADATRYYLIRLDTMNQDLKLERQHVKRMCDDLEPALALLKKNGIHFIDNVKFQFEHYDDDTGAWCEDVFLEEGCTIGWFFCLLPALTDLSLCCHLRTVGWLNKTRFKDLWLSPEYERYRRQAKDLKFNKDVTFMNGVKLYDEHCTHCDNHQTLIYNADEMKRLGWYDYRKVKSMKETHCNTYF